ncbi:hypothetical protein EYF80_054312 [Liparis tanakae]|uniref:Uncharacterized protein n=1 Tax=Liparis tanakae TaxID=230148 RepID=A0A4Z2F423_9TELE|nr:hypothetical protein EYF80_054312 [Liparis tanakae]
MSPTAQARNGPSICGCLEAPTTDQQQTSNCPVTDQQQTSNCPVTDQQLPTLKEDHRESQTLLEEEGEGLLGLMPHEQAVGCSWAEEEEQEEEEEEEEEAPRAAESYMCVNTGGPTQRNPLRQAKSPPPSSSVTPPGLVGAALSPVASGPPTSSLSSAWMKRGRAKPTWASSVIRTRYSELLNVGALSFLSISRMVNVVFTVASEGLRHECHRTVSRSGEEERRGGGATRAAERRAPSGGRCRAVLSGVERCR